MQSVLFLLLAALQPSAQSVEPSTEATPADKRCTSPEGLPLLVCVPSTEPVLEPRSVEAPVQKKLDRSMANQSFLKASNDWGECLRRLAAATGSDKFEMDVLTIEAVRQCGTHESALAQAFVDARANEGLPTTVGEREEFRQTMRELAVRNLISSR